MRILVMIMSKHNAKSEHELMVHIADVLDRIEERLLKQQSHSKVASPPPKVKQPPKNKNVNTKTIRSSNKN